MCQPKPLARCSNHATKNIVTAEHNWRVAQVVAVAASREVVPLEEEYSKALFQHNPNNVKVTFGEEKWPEVAKVSKKLQRARDKKVKTRSQVIDAEKNFDMKQFELDTSKEGYQALLKDKDALHRDARLFAADHGMAWQDKVKKMKDNNGNPLLSKEGKKSPETFEKLTSLHQQAERELNATYMNTRKAIDKQDKETREYTRMYDSYKNKIRLGTNTSKDDSDIKFSLNEVEKSRKQVEKCNHIITMYRSQAEGLKTVLKSIKKDNDLSAQPNAQVNSSSRVPSDRKSTTRLSKMKKVAARVENKKTVSA